MGDKKVVLIAGCLGSIGHATALLLACDGKFKVYVIVSDKDKKEGLERAAGGRLNDTLFIKELEASTDELVSNVVEEIQIRDGRIDVLVNDTDAGISGPVENIPFDKISQLFDVNVYNVIRTIKEVLPGMKKKCSGHVIIISSVDGILGTPFSSITCASRFALEGLAEGLAAEVNRFNIRVSLIEPGPVLSNLPENALDQGSNSKETVETVDSLTKSLFTICQEKQLGIYKTMGQRPDDIAGVVLSAISNSSPHFRYMTNKLYTSAVSEKLVDNTGDKAMASLRDKFSA